MTTTNKGIDYGRGQTNIDHESGIRFGVISQNEVLQAWSDSSEPDYGPACCPKCGNEVEEVKSDDDGNLIIPDDFEIAEHESTDYICQSCQYVFGSESAFPDEVNAFVLDDGEYKATSDSYGDIFILKSPYYSYAQFCSPCAPGAGYLMSEIDDHDENNKAYCFGHDFFEEGKAPYKVYSVETNQEVLPA